MTRLKTRDVCHISSRLEEYDQQLLAGSGRTLLGIACHACGVDEIKIKHQMNAFTIQVVPITMGRGIISGFTQAVLAILTFLGFDARITENPDISGIAGSFESDSDAIMMADDHRFVGINLKNGFVTDNSEATGKVFAAALDLMARGIRNRRVLVLGCGPVGEAAANALLSFGARVTLHDIHISTALALKERIFSGQNIAVESDVDVALSHHEYVLEATPSANTIPDGRISSDMIVAAPGVPLGISKNGCHILGDRLIHDKLELGVAAMAISLLRVKKSFYGKNRAVSFEDNNLCCGTKNQLPYL